MAIIINGTSYSGKNGIKTGGDYYSKVVLSASVSGTPAVGTAFSALTVSASITLPDLGINTPITVTGFTRSAGTVAAGSNSMTVTWKGISKVITFTGEDGETDGVTLNHSTLSVEEGGTATLTAALTGSLSGTITWESDDQSAVTVDASGTTVTVTAVGTEGDTATITASCGAYTASCVVTITAQESEPSWLPEQPTPVAAPAGKTLMATATKTVDSNKNLNGAIGTTYDVTFEAAVNLSDVTHIRITSDMADIANGIYVIVASGLFEKGKGALESGVTDYNGSPVTVDDGDTIFGTGGNESGVTLGLTTIAGQTVHYDTGKNGHMIVAVSGSTLTIKVMNVNNGAYLRQNQKITVELYGDESA